MSTNDEIAKQIEKDRIKNEKTKARPVIVKGNQVEYAKYIWTGGAILVDVATAYLVYVLSNWMPYGVFWLLAGAFGLIWSQSMRERVNNNAQQRRMGEIGVMVSAIAIALMALFAGIVYELGMRGDWVGSIIVAVVIGLALFHVYNAYQYHAADDGVKAAAREAELEAQTEREINEIYRAARVVEAKKRELATLANLEQEHGAAMRAALGATYAADVDQASLQRPNGHGEDTENPT